MCTYMEFHLQFYRHISNFKCLYKIHTLELYLKRGKRSTIKSIRNLYGRTWGYSTIGKMLRGCRILVWLPASSKPSVVLHTCDHNTPELEAERTEVQGHSWLCNKLEDSLGPYLNTQKRNLIVNWRVQNGSFYMLKCDLLFYLIHFCKIWSWHFVRICLIAMHSTYSLILVLRQNVSL